MRTGNHFLSILFGSLLYLLPGFLLSQQNFVLVPKFAEGQLEDFAFLKDLELKWADSLAVETALSNLIMSCRSNGYLTASADQVAWKQKELHALITPGPVFNWIEIDNSSIDGFLWEKANVNLDRIQGKRIIPNELIALEEKLLDGAANNGYPFATVFLDSLEIVDRGVKAKLKLKKGQRFSFGPVRLIGDANISPKYLQQYLGVPIGMPYEKDKIEALPNRIKELPFVESTQRPTVSFEGKKAIINLFLRPRKASRWDAILGYLPRTNSLNPDENEKDLFTLSLLADLNNQLGLGEKIFFQFEQLQPQRQELEVKLNYPYAFGLPFGASGEFSIYRRDSSFTDINSELGVQYLFSGNNFIKVFWENRITNLAKIDTTNILISRDLPDQLDTRNALFGIEWQQQKLNYRFNPRSGWAVRLRSGFGLKNIKTNNGILELARENFNPQALYDSLSQQSWQIRLQGQAEGYLPIGKSSTIKIGIRSGVILAESDIFRNEQYRIGGNLLLRGFDEESFNASTFAVSTLEYRLLLSTNSAIFTFADVGYVEDITVQTKQFDVPIGLGAGIRFETKIGIFGFSLAVGRQRETSFDFRRVKTHFGYVSLF